MGGIIAPLFLYETDVVAAVDFVAADTPVADVAVAANILLLVRPGFYIPCSYNIRVQ